MKSFQSLFFPNTTQPQPNPNSNPNPQPQPLFLSGVPAKHRNLLYKVNSKLNNMIQK